jgi:hypothetical protein
MFTDCGYVRKRRCLIDIDSADAYRGRDWMKLPENEFASKGYKDQAGIATLIHTR